MNVDMTLELNKLQIIGWLEQIIQVTGFKFDKLCILIHFGQLFGTAVLKMFGTNN